MGISSSLNWMRGAFPSIISGPFRIKTPCGSLETSCSWVCKLVIRGTIALSPSPKTTASKSMSELGWYLFVMFKKVGKTNTIKTFHQDAISKRVNIMKNSLPSILMKSNKIQVTSEVQKTHGFLLDFED